MNTRNLSLGLGVLLIGFAALLVWTRAPESGGKKLQNGRASDASGSRGSTVLVRELRREKTGEPVPRKADQDLIDAYEGYVLSSDRGHSDLEQLLASNGIDNDLELMLEALKGDSSSLVQIFHWPPTDGAATESFYASIEMLIEQLGDRYFSYHLAKQPDEVQRRIMMALKVQCGNEDTKYPRARSIMLSVLSEEEIGGGR